jgi:DNA (cytosine-5)-methyltransferase 1
VNVYYNEFEPYAAEWLRNLMAAGHLPEGDVDERDMREVTPDDLKGYDQCHFFAGIGGWPHALNLAGWEGPVWTGSCPCQPLSSAGQRKGHADERHLWPAFYDLIAECAPPVVFGEQVASKDGREWLAGVRADLESVGYAIGAADMPAASVGAPHIRQRLWWVGNPEGERLIGGGPDQGQQLQRAGAIEGTGRADHWADHDLIPCADGKARRIEPGIQPLAHGVPARVGKLRAAGNAIVPQVAAEFVKAVMET